MIDFKVNEKALFYYTEDKRAIAKIFGISDRGYERFAITFTNEHGDVFNKTVARECLKRVDVDNLKPGDKFKINKTKYKVIAGFYDEHLQAKTYYCVYIEDEKLKGLTTVRSATQITDLLV